MSVFRKIAPIIIASLMLMGQAAVSAPDYGTDFSRKELDPSAQINQQIGLMDRQFSQLNASLALLPKTAVIGPKIIQELDIDREGLELASLKVEESILEALEQIEDQYKDKIPTERLTLAMVDALPKASGNKQWKCLADALYFEARGEKLRGQRAVAEVIMNRVQSGSYPNDICGVVYQGTGKKYRCQFTFTCDGNPETVHEPRAYERVGKLARLMIDGLYEQNKITKGAIFYHTTAVHPSWANKKTPTSRYGVHIFYR